MESVSEMRDQQPLEPSVSTKDNQEEGVEVQQEESSSSTGSNAKDYPRFVEMDCVAIEMAQTTTAEAGLWHTGARIGNSGASIHSAKWAQCGTNVQMHCSTQSIGMHGEAGRQHSPILQ